jgi:hypothetical protein
MVTYACIDAPTVYLYTLVRNAQLAEHLINIEITRD